MNIFDQTFDLSCVGSGGEANASLSVPVNLLQHDPKISWTAVPVSPVADQQLYTVSAQATDEDGNLSSVRITKDGQSFDDSNLGTSGNTGQTMSVGKQTADAGPKQVTYVASALDATGRSAEIRATVTIETGGKVGCTHSDATNYDPSALTDNGSCRYAPPAATISASNTCVVPNSNVTLTTTVTGGNITSNIIEKDSNQDGIYGTLTDFGAQGGTHSFSTALAQGLYDFRASAVNAGGSGQSSSVRVTVADSCNPSFMCTIFPASCPPVANQTPTAPDFSTYNWYSDDSSSWPTLSTPSALNGNQSMRAKLLTGEQFYNRANGVNSGRLSSSPAAGQTQMQLYVYDYSVGQIVASRTVGVTISSRSGGSTNNGPVNNGGSGPGPGVAPVIPKCSDPLASNQGATGACVYPQFSLSATPNPVKAKSLAGYSGQTEQDTNVTVNPVSGFTAPVLIGVDQNWLNSLPTGTNPEFSFNGGSFSSNPSATLVTDGNFYRVGNGAGPVFLPISVRFSKAITSVRLVGTPQPGGKGSNLGPQTLDIQIDTKPLMPNYKEI
jgi:hypothetical protein